MFLLQALRTGEGDREISEERGRRTCLSSLSGCTCPYLAHSMRALYPRGDGIKQLGPAHPQTLPLLTSDSDPRPDPSLWLAVPVLGAQPSLAALKSSGSLGPGIKCGLKGTPTHPDPGPGCGSSHQTAAGRTAVLDEFIRHSQVVEGFLTSLRLPSPGSSVLCVTWRSSRSQHPQQEAMSIKALKNPAARHSTVGSRQQKDSVP